MSKKEYVVYSTERKKSETRRFFNNASFNSKTECVLEKVIIEANTYKIYNNVELLFFDLKFGINENR